MANKRLRVAAEAEPGAASTTDVRAPAVSGGGRDWILLGLLGGFTALAVALCTLMAAPFLQPLTWALAFAVVAQPVHRALVRRISNRSVAATLAVVFVVTVLLLPIIFAGQQLAREAVAAAESISGGGGAALWETTKAKSGPLKPVVEWVDREWSVGGQLESLPGTLLTGAKTVWSASVGAVLGALVTLFFLFYFFRDRRYLVDAIRGFAPLTANEMATMLKRIDDTIHAMVFGSIGVAVVQGVLGGLMFWWLGLPSPLVWAAVMTICAILPVMGAALVWVPAVIYLLITGSTTQAVILMVWGVVVVSLIDNLLYPMVVKKRLRLHTVPVFIAVLGGIVVFGAAGLVLGPVVLAVTLALIGIWRDRMAGGTRPSHQ